MRIREIVAWFQLIKDRYRNQAAIGILLLALVFIFGKNIKPVLVVTVFIIIASLSTFYHNFFRSPVNFELVKLFTVVGSVAYGAAAGVVIGVSSVAIGRALSGRLDQDTLTSMFAIVIVAFLASIFRVVNIAFLGVILVIVYYLIILPFIFLFGENRGYEAVYIGTNIVLNFVLFTRIAPLLLQFIGP